MSNGKFYGRRTVTKGQMSVQTGYRGGEVQFRFPTPGGTPCSLTYQQASDLADALDEALDQQEQDPLP